MLTENKRARARVDGWLIAAVYALSIAGIFFVAVATYSTDASSDVPLLNHIVASSYAMRQALFVLVSPLVISAMLMVRYQYLRRTAMLLYLAATALVTLVWVFNRAEGVKQWLDILWGFTIQPTEFAKLTIILMLARELSREEKPMANFKEFFRINALVLFPGAIIVLSGETGSFIVIAVFYVIMLYFAKVDIKVLVLMGAAVALLLLAVYGYAVATGSTDYRLLRIVSFFNPEAYTSSGAYQQTQSRMAIGSGGYSGVGFFKDGSMYQLNYVPADWTDFIFATIGESSGFVGCMGVLAMYLFIVLRMFYLARYTRDRFGMLVIVGVASMFLFHVVQNIGMTTGLLPITGIPLPFLSYGGSNMITNMAGIGLVLNVTKNRSLTGSFSTPQNEISIRKYSGSYR